MSEELDRSIAAIREIQAGMSRLESRLERLETVVLGERPPTVPVHEETVPEMPLEEELPPPRPAPLNSVLIGRSLIVFGGAYLLRALTESGAFPVMVGAVAGLLYAAVFLFLAHRQSRQAPASASFHATTAILIAMPLAVETTIFFREIAPAVAFAVVMFFYIASGTIAISRRLRALSWITEVVTLAAILVLTIGSRSFVLGLLALLVLGLTTLYGARRMSSPSLIFLPAVSSCLLVLPIADLSMTDRAPPGAVTGLLSILVFLAAWTVGLMVDSRRHPDRPGPGLIILLGFVMLIGVGSGFWVAHRMNIAFLYAPITGAIALATGIYSWHLTVRAGDDDRRSVIFVLVTSLLLMAMTGSILGPEASALTWLVLAAVSVLLARSGHPLLFAPCFIFVIGASLESGLITWITRALLKVPDPSAIIPTASGITTLLASIAFLASTPRGSIRLGALRSAVDATTTTLLVAASAALAIRGLQPLLGGFGMSVDDPGNIAAIRTIVLSMTAIALAWLARWPRSRTIGVLVNPILILTAILIVVINVRVGRAATHFPAFSVYGLALIVAPALKRRSMAQRRERMGDQDDGSSGVPAEPGAELAPDAGHRIRPAGEK